MLRDSVKPISHKKIQDPWPHAGGTCRRRGHRRVAVGVLPAAIHCIALHLYARGGGACVYPSDSRPRRDLRGYVLGTDASACPLQPLFFRFHVGENGELFQKLLQTLRT